MAEELSGGGGLEGGTLLRLVLGAVLAVALIAFVGQNRDDVQVDWLFFDFTLPLWFLLLITAVLGAGLGGIGNWALRRRRD